MTIHVGNTAIRAGEYGVYSFCVPNEVPLIVRPDSDGLGLVELDGGDYFGTLIIAPDMVGPLIAALKRVTSDMAAH